MPPKTSSILVLGSEQAGKTCFLAGLEVLSEADRESDFSLSSEGKAKDYAHSLASNLRAQKWPPPTSRQAQSEFEGNLCYKGRILHLSLLDYAGETFREGMAQGKELPEKVKDGLRKADYLLLALPPEMITKTLKKGPEDDRQYYHDTIDSLHEAVQQQRFRRGNSNPLKVAVLITKADLIEGQLMKPQEAEEFLKKHLDAFCQKLKTQFPGFKVFAVSAVGKTVENNDRKLRPAQHLEPSGYDHLFEWIIRDIRRKRCKKRFLHVMFMVIVLLLCAGLLLWWSKYQDDTLTEEIAAKERQSLGPEEVTNLTELRRRQRESNYRADVDRAIEDSSLATANPNTHRNDLQQILARLLAMQGTNRQYQQARIDEAVIEVNRLLQQLDYDEVKNLRENGSPAFLEKAIAFRSNYVNSEFTTEVQDWIEQAASNERQRAARNIYGMESSSRAAFEAKYKAIDEFRGKYPNVQGAADMGKASKLAIRLLEEAKEDRLRISLKSVGRIRGGKSAYRSEERRVGKECW